MNEAIEKSKIRKYNEDYKNEILQDCKGNDFVYHFYKMKYLIQDLKEQKNTLVPIELWEDPCELFYFHELYATLHISELSDEESNKECHQFSESKKIVCPVDTSETRKRIFGQCWTMQDEQDYQWKYYDADVRVKMKLKDLLDGFFDVDDDCMCAKYHARKIDYYGADEMKNIKEITPLQEMIDTCFKKRKEFEFEKEFRILYTIDSDSTPGKFYNYAINASDFYKEVLVSPYRCDCEFEKIKNELNKFGLNNNNVNITQSTLTKLTEVTKYKKIFNSE